MTTRASQTLALAAVAALAACGPHRIPGTDIRDTADTRAIYDVLRTYRQALERRDAPALLALTAPDYFDNAGTPDPADDMDRARLEKTLPEDLAKLEGLRVEVTPRRIDVKDATAVAEVFYDAYYRVQTPSGPAPRHDSDIHQIRLKKLGNDWKITSGL
jgi:hypothetical protein